MGINGIYYQCIENAYHENPRCKQELVGAQVRVKMQDLILN